MSTKCAVKGCKNLATSKGYCPKHYQRLIRFGSTDLPEGVENPKEFVFGDPNAYDKMSEEEKEELTQKMMGNWASFTKGGGIGGKNG